MVIETFVQFMQKIMLFTSYVNNNSSFPKPLTQQEEQEYITNPLGAADPAQLKDSANYGQ